MREKLINKVAPLTLGILIVLGVTVIWHGLIAIPLDPQWKDWIPYPSLAENYKFYSLITFSTSGALLFKSGFYGWLYGAVRGDEDRKIIKGLVWGCLIGITVAVVYATIWTLNILLNLAYSGLIVGLILLPLVMSSLFVAVILRIKSLRVNRAKDDKDGA